MTIKDITILKSITPITLVDKPNRQTIEYLAKIVQDKEFDNYIRAIRNQNNLPENGIPIKEFIGRNFFELPTISNQLVLLTFQNTAHSLCNALGISDDFNTPILLLLFFNAFIDVEYFEGFITQPIQYILGRKNIGSSMYDYPHEVGAIIIPFNLSQNTLNKWITHNWDSIQKQMDENLTTDPYLLRLHQNTELAIEITELKERQGKSYFEIADILAERHPEDEKVKDGEWIKKTYKDYKEIWNSLKKQPQNN